MAFGDLVGAASKVSLASGEAALGCTASSGELLIFAIGRSATHSAGGSWGTPVGWSPIEDSGIAACNMGGAAFYKIADGTETGASTIGASTQGNTQAMILRFEGPWASSPLDKIAEDTGNLGIVSGSMSTGTTAATDQADELAIAVFAFDRFDAIDTSRTYTNDFTEVAITDISTARAGAVVAKKVLSATGAVECTFSFTDTGDEMYGLVGTFRKLVAAGGGDGLTPGKLQAMTGITY